MKKLLILIIVLILIIAGVLVYGALNANNLVQKYKPELETAISKSLDSQVTLGDLNVKIFPKTKIDISSLKIQKDPKQNGFELKNFSLALKLLPVLLEQKLVITELIIDQPTIELIKTKSGVHLRGLEPKAKTENATVVNQQPATSNQVETNTAATTSPLDLDLNFFELKNAEIVFKDKTQNTEYRVKNVNVNTEVELKNNTANIKALKGSALIQDQIQVQLTSPSIKYNLESGNAEVQDFSVDFAESNFLINSNLDTKKLIGKIALRGTGINIQKITEAGSVFVPSLKTIVATGTALPNIDLELNSMDNIKGSGNIKLTDISYPLPNLNIAGINGNLPLQIVNQSVSINSDDLNLNLNSSPIKINFKAQADANQVNLEQANIESFSGKTNISAKLDLKNQQPFNVILNTQGIAIAELLKTFAPNTPASLTGTIKKFNANLNGKLNTADIIQATAGAIDLNIGDGELVGTNIAGEVIQALSKLPFLTGALTSGLSAEEKAAIDSRNTALKTLSGNFNLLGGNLTTNNLLIESTVFDVNGKGLVSLTNNCEFNTEIVFNQLISQALAKSTKEVKSLLDERGRLGLPLVLKGPLSKLKVLPDVEELAKKAAKGLIKGKAEEAIGNLLGGKSNSKSIGKVFGF